LSERSFNISRFSLALTENPSLRVIRQQLYTFNRIAGAMG
jgi:hypothetical protein